MKITKKNKTPKTQEDKLYLILDLDCTLIHCCRNFPKTENRDNFFHFFQSNELLRKRHDIEIFDFEENGNYYTYMLKIRKHLHTLLKELSQQFILCVYTHGTKNYANKILSIIDKDNKFFNNRVVSRGTKEKIIAKTLTPLTKKIINDDTIFNDGKQCRSLIVSDNTESMRDIILKKCLIVDDREDVWEYDLKKYLIIADRYHYFNEEFIENGIKNTEMMKKKLKMDLNDYYFQTLYSNLEKIYNVWNENNTVDVSEILKKFKKVVFKDCMFLFSGLVPKAYSGDHDYYLKTIEYGATFIRECNEESNLPFTVTHCICPKNLQFPTQKIGYCKKAGVQIVNDKWFWDSIHRLEMQPTKEYCMFLDNPQNNAKKRKFDKVSSNGSNQLEPPLKRVKIDENVDESGMVQVKVVLEDGGENVIKVIDLPTDVNTISLLNELLRSELSLGLKVIKQVEYVYSDLRGEFISPITSDIQVAALKNVFRNQSNDYLRCIVYS